MSNTQLRKQHIHDALASVDWNFVVSDPYQEDNPLVYASEGFYRLTGYTQAEILGKNCRFLQGTKTDRRKVAAIRQAVREGQACQWCVNLSSTVEKRLDLQNFPTPTNNKLTNPLFHTPNTTPFSFL